MTDDANLYKLSKTLVFEVRYLRQESRHLWFCSQCPKDNQRRCQQGRWPVDRHWRRCTLEKLLRGVSRQTLISFMKLVYFSSLLKISIDCFSDSIAYLNCSNNQTLPRSKSEFFWPDWLIQSNFSYYAPIQLFSIW